MQKILSDIDLSRSAPVAIFLELEEAARTCTWLLLLLHHCFLLNFHKNTRNVHTQPAMSLEKRSIYLMLPLASTSVWVWSIRRILQFSI